MFLKAGRTAVFLSLGEFTWSQGPSFAALFLPLGIRKAGILV